MTKGTPDRKSVDSLAAELVGMLRETFDQVAKPTPHDVRAHFWKERCIELWVEAQVAHKILLLAVALVHRGELSPADLPDILLDLANRLEYVTKEVIGAKPERPVAPRPGQGQSNPPTGAAPPTDAR